MLLTALSRKQTNLKSGTWQNKAYKCDRAGTVNMGTSDGICNGQRWRITLSYVLEKIDCCDRQWRFPDAANRPLSLLGKRGAPIRDAIRYFKILVNRDWQPLQKPLQWQSDVPTITGSIKISRNLFTLEGSAESVPAFHAHNTVDSWVAVRSTIFRWYYHVFQIFLGLLNLHICRYRSWAKSQRVSGIKEEDLFKYVMHQPKTDRCEMQTTSSYKHEWAEVIERCFATYLAKSSQTPQG